MIMGLKWLKKAPRSKKDRCKSSIEQNMRANGLLEKIFGQERVNKFGQTGQYMKDGGGATRPTARADSYMQMGTFMMANGWMTKPMDKEYTVTLTEQGMKATGKRISNREMELKLGRMEPNMMDNISEARSTALGNSRGLMVAHIMESS
jgi:hypothetical protein